MGSPAKAFVENSVTSGIKMNLLQSLIVASRGRSKWKYSTL
jgi:hypothetical protein